jgi:hypothetical protein
MVVDFELDGQRLTALNGGPHFKFNEAVSLVVHCQSPEEGTTTGTGSPRTATPALNNAAGSRTASACPGRSCPIR